MTSFCFLSHWLNLIKSILFFHSHTHSVIHTRNYSPLLIHSLPTSHNFSHSHTITCSLTHSFTVSFHTLVYLLVFLVTLSTIVTSRYSLIFSCSSSRATKIYYSSFEFFTFSIIVWRWRIPFHLSFYISLLRFSCAPATLNKHIRLKNPQLRY